MRPIGKQEPALRARNPRPPQEPPLFNAAQGAADEGADFDAGEPSAPLPLPADAPAAPPPFAAPPSFAPSADSPAVSATGTRPVVSAHSATSTLATADSASSDAAPASATPAPRPSLASSLARRHSATPDLAAPPLAPTTPTSSAPLGPPPSNHPHGSPPDAPPHQSAPTTPQAWRSSNQSENNARRRPSFDHSKVSAALKSAGTKAAGTKAAAAKKKISSPGAEKLRYRLERFFMSRTYAVLRAFVPVICVVLLVGAMLAPESRRSWLVERYDIVIDYFRTRPENLITSIKIEGASPYLENELEKALGLSFPVSIFDLDLQALQMRLQAYDAVADAGLLLQADGVLYVSVRERIPVAVLLTHDAVVLVDAQGLRTAALHARSDRPDLPLIAGKGAQENVPEARALFAAAAPISERVRGLVRVGERRWDLVLDRGQRILLPAQAPVAALERLIALEQAQDLLARAITVVDLRLAHMIVVRLAPPPPNAQDADDETGLQQSAAPRTIARSPHRHAALPPLSSLQLIRKFAHG